MIKDVNDKTLVDRIIPSGDNYIAPRTLGLRLTTSNAGGLQVFLDGTEISSLGKQGEFVVGRPFDKLVMTAKAHNQ
jgi:hypothetical protein